MKIANNVLRHYLKNVLFLNGTAYAGKSTMCRLLAERYGLVHCGENYMLDRMLRVVTPEQQPNLCYFHTQRDWQEFLNRAPEEYLAWIRGNSREAADFEIAELIRLSADRRVIVDTDIPCEILQQIAGYHQVAVLLSPQSMSVERFFDRPDPEKQFLLEQIRQARDPEKTMANFRACIAAVNSPEWYAMWEQSGFYTIVREDTETDTRQETLEKLARHFGLGIQVLRLQPGDAYWERTIDYAAHSAWELVGKHLADMMRKAAFFDWESVFICLVDGEIVGYCTFLKEDFYPENRYSPWISTVFVEERCRGSRLSHRMISAAIAYAREQGFTKVYIPSDMVGFYEKCGFTAIDHLTNYLGDTDTVFMKEI